MKDSSRPPSLNLEWSRPASGGNGPGQAVPIELLLRRARTAMVVNIVVAVCFFGLLSIPGAISAGMARQAAPHDPDRAARLSRWSWAFLATNLMFYLLLLAVIGVLAAYLYLIARSGS